MLSDIYGRRKVILSATFVFASAPFLYFLVNAPWHLAIVRVYHGLATAIFGPVAMALVADLFKERRAENMGWYSSSTLVGRSLAPVVGGAILFQFDNNYKLVYLVCGIAGILAFILAFLIPSKQQVVTASGRFSDKLREMGKGLKEIGSSRGIMVTSSVEAIQYLSFGALETFLPLYCIIVAGMNTAAVGMLFTIQLIGTTLTKPVMGRLSDKYGRKQMISIGLAIGAVALGLIPFFKSFWTLIPAAVLFGISLATVTASTAALVSDMAKAGAYGSALGVMSTIMDIGHSSGPIISGILLSFYQSKYGAEGSYMPMFLIVCTILLASGLLFPIMVGRIERQQ